MNFSESFFIDEVATINLSNKIYTAPELKRYSNIVPQNESRDEIDISKAELWTLGYLLYEMHF